MSTHFRKLHIEHMERREMMAGDISAFMSGGSLYLYETAGQTGRDNSVVVTDGPSGVRVVGGMNADGTTSKVNGAAYQDFDVLFGLNINFGGGNDTVVVDKTGFLNINVNVAGSSTVTRTPSSTKSASTFYPSFPTDSDRVTIKNLATEGLITVNTGVGNDIVDLSYVNAGTNGPHSHNGTGGVTINTGVGNDTVRLNDVFSYHDINVNTGAGNDRVEASFVTFYDNFLAQLGEGDDVMVTKELNTPYNSHYGITGNTKISAGDGTDRLTTTGKFPSTNLDLTGWDYINGIHQTSSLPDNVSTRV